MTLFSVQSLHVVHAVWCSLLCLLLVGNKTAAQSQGKAYVDDSGVVHAHHISSSRASPRPRSYAIVHPHSTASKLQLDHDGLNVLRSIKGPVAPVVVRGWWW